MNNVGSFETEVLRSRELNFVQLKDSHPRRIETGLNAMVYLKETGTVDVMFKPIKRSKFSDVEHILVSGQFKDIKKCFKKLIYY